MIETKICTICRFEKQKLFLLKKFFINIQTYVRAARTL